MLQWEPKMDKKNPSSRTMALESTQPLTEIFLEVKGGWPVRKADNLSAICEPIV
jgi:hypothetical protein